MGAPPISEATIRHNSTANSFSRGEDYYTQGAVTDLVQRDRTIYAEVEGSEVAPYRVTLQFDSGGITSARCTCPYDYEGWCKHIVAVGLAWIRHPDLVEVRPTLEQLIGRLDANQTKQLIRVLVGEHPELMDDVDRQVLLMTNPPAPKQTAKNRRRTTLDVAPFKRQVKNILREGVRSLEEGYEDDPFTEDLEEVIEKALAFARSEDAENAIAFLQAITETCVSEWDDIADYGGDSFPIAETLNEAWAEVILSEEIATPDVVDLQVLLEDWQDTMNVDFSMSLAALQQGWHHPELKEVLAGNGSFSSDHFEFPYAQDLVLIRLQILDSQDRQQEYLNLAKAEGLMLQYLTRLAELGNIDEAMATARESMTTAEEAFALAKTLRESNHLSEALAIARTGLPLPGRYRYDLASWTSELAEGLGDRDVALEASILAFELRPSFADYQRVQHFAADQWESLKLDLLKVLRQSEMWTSQEARVDIFLHEGLIDDAIASVRSDTYYRSEFVHRVMQAAIASHPDWVIEAARKRAEPIMDQGKAERYQEAVNWLKEAKAAHLHSNQKADWTTYFSQLQSKHIRKRKLMELFKQLF